MQELGRGEHRPHALERLAHDGVVPEPVAHVGDVGLEARAGGQRFVEADLDELAAGVVRAGPPPGVRHDLLGALGRDPQHLDAVADRQVVAQRAAPVAHGLGEHLRHAEVALDARRRGRVVAADRGWLGEEVGEHGELDAGLAERRQHLLDVAEEQPVGPEHQHALALEREAVGVEQVGGAVQGDDRLAGARAALHDEDAGKLGPDDLVLLALDRGDDVGQAAGAAGLEGGDQRAVPGDAPGAGVLLLDEPDGVGGVAEELVLDAEQRARPGGEVAAPGEAHGLAARGPVEGLGDRRPPVDHDGVAVGVGDGHPTDVPGVAGHAVLARAVEVDATEDQGGVAELERLEAVGDRVGDDVALEAGLFGAALADLDHRLEPGGTATGVLQALVGVVDVRLLGDEFGVRRQGCQGGF